MKKKDQHLVPPTLGESAKGTDLFLGLRLAKMATNRLPEIKPNPAAFIPIPIETIPLDQPVPFPVYLKVSGQFILFRVQGDLLTDRRVKLLREKNVGLAFVPEHGWQVYMKSLEAEASEDPNTKSYTAERSITRLRHLLVAYGQELERSKKLQQEHLGKLHNLGQRLAEGITRDPALGAKLLRRHTDPTLYFVNHNVNVAIYCAAVAQKLSMSREDTKQLTFAALVHNVGNLFIPREILFKPTSLTRKEWELMVTHPPMGARLLQDLNAPKEVILTAMQHHERVDGLGYPENRPGVDIHLFAKITSIADVFDAMTSNSPYRAAMSAAEAVEKMSAMGGKFDPQILKMLSVVKQSGE